MKNYLLVLGMGFLLLISCQNSKQEEHGHQHDEHPQETATNPANTKKSIPKEAHGQVGNVHVSINYHSPGARGRVIYGGLVPFGEVWVTGAHNATKVTFSEEIEIEGKKIPPASYAFFTIPGENTWTIILNKNWEQHLADEYNPDEDVIRVEVIPEMGLPIQERLEYSIEDVGNSQGTIRMQWEKRAVSLAFNTTN
jgi:hypothetical protein